jgi:tetratricopeptide (TPR) repeat protein
MKRLNLKLLTWLVGITLVLVIGVFIVWQVQMKRNSGRHIDWANQAAEKGDLPEEIRQLRRYLMFDKANVEIQRRYALRLCDMAESPKADRNVLMIALEQLQRARRNNDKDQEVIDRLATFYQRLGRAPEAMQLFEQLLALDPKNTEAKKKLAECNLVTRNFDEAIRLLEAAIEEKPTDVSSYGRLAAVYEGGIQKPEEAAKTLDRMVNANPDNWEAFLARYNYLRTHNKSQEAEQDLNRALELEPLQLSVLLAASERAATARDFEKARGFLERAREAHPTSREVYVNLSNRGRAQNDPVEAEKWLNEGLQADHVGEDRALLWMLADLKVISRDLDASRALIPRLEKAGTMKEQVDFLRALIFMQEKKYTDALAILDRVRPQVANIPQFEEQIDNHRAICYRALGQPDREIEVYRQRLLANPLAINTRIDLARALLMNGQTEDAIQELQSVGNDIRAQALLYQAILVRNMRAPEDKRDWAKTDELVQQIRAQNPDSPNGLAIEVDYLLKKGQPDVAASMLSASREKFQDSVIFWRALAEVSAAKDGPAAGLKVVEEAVQKIGDSSDLRMQRISYLSQIGDDASKQKIAEIVAKVDEFPEADRIPNLQAAAGAFYRLRDFDHAKQYYEEVAKRDPTDLTSLLMIFSVARDANDEATMQSAINRIKEMVGEKNSYYLFCQASAKVWEVIQGKSKPTELAVAGELLDRAAQQRPNWGLLLSLRGEIEEREGNNDAAIANYKRAVSLGDNSPQLLRRLVLLLVNRGRGAEVKPLLEALPNPREALGPRLFVVIELLEGKVHDAMSVAREAVAEDPENAQIQLWFALIAANSGFDDESEKAYRRAAELAPDNADCWLGLFRFLVERDQREEARTLLPNIEKNVAEKARPMVLAQCRELLGDNLDAEKLYLEAVAAAPTNLANKRELASFYARMKNADAVNKVLTELSDVGLAAKAKGLSEEDRPHVLWANRLLASMTAQQGSLETLRDAIAIVDRNANPDGKLDPDDRSLKVSLMQRTGDPTDRKEAIKILEGLLADDPARSADRLQLAKLLDRDNRWSECKDQMLTLLSMQQATPEFNLTYAEMLIRHNEPDNATGLIAKLEETHPRDPLFLALKGHLLARQGKATEAINLLRGQIVRPLPPQQVPLLKAVAGQFMDMSAGSSEANLFQDAAEELLREYVVEVPGDSLVLAEFLGRRGNLEEAFKLCNECVAQKMKIEPITRLAMTLLNDHQTKATDAMYADAEKWLNQGLADADKTDDVPIMLQLAQLHDLRGNYDSAVKVYRELLDGQELDRLAKITVYNNLAFILALRDKSSKEAEPLIDKAIVEAGRNVSELLDTRGVVKLASGNVDGALLDLLEAVGSSNPPSAVKYFHLAWAQHEKHQDAEAAKSFEEAQKLGLNAKTISALERPKFDELRKVLPQTQAAAP